MRRRLFPAVVGLGISFLVVAATVAVVGGGRDDGGGVVGDGDGLIILTWCGATQTVLLGSPRAQLAP